MISTDPIAINQLSAIRQIIIDETWLESERRGCRVAETDQVVRDNVCRVVLRNGAQMRESARRATASAPSMNSFPVGAQMALADA